MIGTIFSHDKQIGAGEKTGTYAGTKVLDCLNQIELGYC